MLRSTAHMNATTESSTYYIIFSAIFSLIILYKIICEYLASSLTPQDMNYICIQNISQNRNKKYKVVQWRSWLERQSSKREIVGSRPTVDKIFFLFVILAFFTCEARRRMKTSVTYTYSIPCLVREWYVIDGSL